MNDSVLIEMKYTRYACAACSRILMHDTYYALKVTTQDDIAIRTIARSAKT